MKRKIILLFLLFFLTCGCTSLEKESYETIINTTLLSNVSITNQNRVGYKYYLPRGVRLLNKENNNEILSLQNTIYYLYVDYVSYYNKKKESYTVKEDAIYSTALENGDLFGYIEIKNTSNDKYFVEIMYNYAKIEVIVEKSEVKTCVSYALSILSSIQYQDTTLQSLMGEDALKQNEVEHNIFETAKTESNYLQIVEEYGTYESDDTVDPDFIRR